jgi:tetratricopeptide (TPR) repeat protein
VTEPLDKADFQVEFERIAKSPQFARSPVLRRLLAFLIEETLAGRGGRLKAYQIAVDGLGRAEDFDPQSDSYPRVQVGRLRKILDLFYASNGMAEVRPNARLRIPNGQYCVYFDQALDQTDSDGVNLETDDCSQDPALSFASATPALHGPAISPPISAARWPNFYWKSLGAMLMIFGFAAIWLSMVENSDAKTENSNPLNLPRIEISLDTDNPDNPELRAVRQHLQIGLQRFERLVVIDPMIRGQRPAMQNARDYVLELSPSGTPQQPVVFVQLRHLDSKTNLWSQHIPVGPDIERDTNRVVSSIAQHQGLIDAHQIASGSRRLDDGYSCLLWHYKLRASPDTGLRKKVLDCLDDGLEKLPDNPLLLEARSTVKFAMGVQTDAKSRSETRAYAERALAFGSNYATANIGAARTAMLYNNCDRAILYTQRAAELNPLDPDNLAIAGSFAAACGQLTESQQYLERSAELDQNGSLAQQMGILKLALVQNDSAHTLKIIKQLDSANARPNPVFLLARVLIYIEIGENADARNAWVQLTQAMGQPVDAPVRKVVKGFVLPDQFADAIIARMNQIELSHADNRGQTSHDSDDFST